MGEVYHCGTHQPGKTKKQQVETQRQNLEGRMG